MAQIPFWKQPRGMILIAGGAVVLLATLWVFATSLGPSPPVVEGVVPANHIDENALIAANAERADQAAAANNAVPSNAAKPATTEEVASVSTPPEPPRFNPDEIAAEAEAAIEEAREEVEGLKPPTDIEEDGDKPERN